MENTWDEQTDAAVAVDAEEWYDDMGFACAANASET